MSLNGVCRRKIHGKGVKLNTFLPSYIIILISVVVKKSRPPQDVRVRYLI